jgi:hypothetical protein
VFSSGSVQMYPYFTIRALWLFTTGSQSCQKSLVMIAQLKQSSGFKISTIESLNSARRYEIESMRENGNKTGKWRIG